MSCKRPTLIKNEFISTFIGTFGILLGLSFIFPLSAFSVYITSYVHEKQKFVTMYYGLFFHLIFSFAMTFGMSIGGFLELKLGFYLTTLFGLLIILASNIIFLNAQNIWLCYVLTFLMASGAGISNSLTGKNLAFFKPNRKGLLISILGAITTLFAGVFSITGEKLINPVGYTLKQNEVYYDYQFSSRTYIYFTMGFFSIPIGVIIFLLFIIEYKEKESKASEEKDEETEAIKEAKETKENKNEENVNVEENKIENDEYININVVENKNENEENINVVENKNEKEENINVVENKNEKEENINDEENKNEDDENNKKEEEEENELIISKNIREINKKQKIKKVIKTFRFWRLSICLFLVTFSFSFILGTGRTFGALIGIQGNALQLLMLCQSGALIIIGPLLGFFVDKRGPLIFLRIATIVLIIPGILLTFFTKNSVIFIISFAISILGLVSSMVCIAPYIMDIYGIQESVILGGIMNVFARLADVIVTVVAFVISFFYNKEEIIFPYRIMYIVGSVCCLVSFILLIFEKKDKFDYGDKEEEDKEDIGNIVENSRITEN